MWQINRTAVQATLHCLTGCAIGEIAGLVMGTAANLSNSMTIALSVTLAFIFGYSLSLRTLLKDGLAFKTAFGIALAADTLSIATMEVMDSLTMVLIPGAMNATLLNLLFWLSMGAALIVAFLAALPVNSYLISKGKGHALAHAHHP